MTPFLFLLAQGAGGAGGLKAMIVHNGSLAGTYFYNYDGNGNVTTLIGAADGAEAARYEYGPFLELTRATGPMARLNPFRASTKYQDDETDLLYYGFRYLSSATGRWLSRDPIEEAGGVNQTAFWQNDPVDFVDVLGLAPDGPYHPPAGVKLSCDKCDTCPQILGKLTVLTRMIDSHTGWDRNMGKPRGGNRHAIEIAELWRAYARCQLLFIEKNCGNSWPKPNSKPELVLIPEPKLTIYDKVLIRVPGSNATWKNVEIGLYGVSATAAVIATGGVIVPYLVTAEGVLVTSGSAAAVLTTTAIPKYAW